MPVHPVVFATPVALLAMAVEHLVGRRQGRSLYRFDGMVGDLSVSVGNAVVQGLFGLTTFAGYAAVEARYGLLEVDPAAWLHWLGLFLAVDVVFYFRHRACHRVAVLWAIHEVHHQSHEYNYGTAQRSPWLQSLPNVPLAMAFAVAGVPLGMIAACFTFKTAYGFFLHTQLVGRLGPLEWLLVTPSNHRVHHARNEAYLDRNFGNVLMVWDHLFGTYTPEGERPDFGVRAERDLDDSWTSNVGPFVELAARAATAPTAWRWLQTWLRPPGWDPRTGTMASHGPTPPRMPALSPTTRWIRAGGFVVCLAATLAVLAVDLPVVVGLTVGTVLMGTLVFVTRPRGRVSARREVASAAA